MMNNDWRPGEHMLFLSQTLSPNDLLGGCCFDLRVLCKCSNTEVSPDVWQTRARINKQPARTHRFCTRGTAARTNRHSNARRDAHLTSAASREGKCCCLLMFVGPSKALQCGKYLTRWKRDLLGIRSVLISEDATDTKRCDEVDYAEMQLFVPLV